MEMELDTGSAVSIMSEDIFRLHFPHSFNEYGTKADRLLSLMEKFATLFGLKLGYFLFGASETLSKTLKSKDITLQQAISAVNLAKAFYKRQRESFDNFYDDVVATALKEEISEPQLPRYGRAPSRVDVEAVLIGLKIQKITIDKSTMRHVSYLLKNLKGDSIKQVCCRLFYALKLFY